MSAMLPCCGISYPFSGYVVRNSLARESSKFGSKKLVNHKVANCGAQANRMAYLLRLREAGEVDQLRRAG